MNIIERPLKAGSKRNNPKMIVIHAMAEYLKDPGLVFAPDFLEKYGLSAHALIVPNGDVMICRNTDQGAYHARGYNTDSLGVEFLVEGVHDYGSFIEAIKKKWVTNEQWNAGIELINHWKSIYNITQMERHSDLSPGRKVDPGAGFNWEGFKRQTGF